MNPPQQPSSPDRGVANARSLWHVSSWVDIMADHFSWLWVLIPLLAVGERHPADSIAVFAFVTAVNFAHRDFTLLQLAAWRRASRRLEIKQLTPGRSFRSTTRCDPHAFPPGGTPRLHGRRDARRYSAASTSAACSPGFTFGQTFRILPSGPIRNVTRCVPVNFIPMKIFGPHTP